jgi:hypothetical protein
VNQPGARRKCTPSTTVSIEVTASSRATTTEASSPLPTTTRSSRSAPPARSSAAILEISESSGVAAQRCR